MTNAARNDRAFVRVQDLKKSFGPTVALKGVSFDVNAGETVSLLGPSGCGKTTILRSIAGLESPDSGRITIGQDLVYEGAQRVNLAPERRNIGMVFQSYAVWPHMTVAENVGFPLRIRRVPAAEMRQRVDKALAMVGLAGYGPRPATNLSGGQQQRVALARAIVHAPPLVLFDEPLSNLDTRLRHQMRTELKELQEQLGFTAIYVTHDQEEALALSDKVIVMNHGEVEMQASPRELFAHPASAFVANFLGYDNMLDGTVVQCGPRESTAYPVTVEFAPGYRLDLEWARDDAPAIRAPVTVAFRSEHVTLDPTGEAAGLPGTVEASVYLGVTEDVFVRAGLLLVRAVVPGGTAPVVGTEVIASVAPEHCIVYPRTSQGGTPA